MIINNIILTVFFIALILICSITALLAYSGSDYKDMKRFLACIAAGFGGIAGVWITGEWSPVMWAYFAAILFAIYKIYRLALLE